jgi:SOS-response transcriptional repressor LexA
MSSTTLQERVTIALSATKGLSQAGLARACEIARSSVNAWVKGGTDSIDGKYLTSAAMYLHVDPHWLSTGEGPMLPLSERRLAPGSLAHLTREYGPMPPTSNVTELDPQRIRVPLISWIQAGELSDVVDLFHPGEAVQWEDALKSKPGHHSYALLVEGDSMVSHTGAHSFPPGTVLIVDPERGANAGDYVIAKDVQTQKATFKQLTTDGARWYLKPLNTQYPTIEIDDPAMRVIGRVIEAKPPSVKL